jgi:hypothetical protein
MVELGMGLLMRGVEVREGGRRLLRVEAAVVEGLGTVRVKDLAVCRSHSGWVRLAEKRKSRMTRTRKKWDLQRNGRRKKRGISVMWRRVIKKKTKI